MLPLLEEVQCGSKLFPNTQYLVLIEDQFKAEDVWVILVAREDGKTLGYYEDPNAVIISQGRCNAIYKLPKS